MSMQYIPESTGRTVLRPDIAGAVASMEYRYSTLVPPGTYDTAGLCPDLPLRRNIRPLAEDIGATRAQEDWNRLVSPLKRYRGELASRFSGVQLAVAECIPDRLEIISYANELAFIYDDFTELFGQKELDEANDSMQAGFDGDEKPVRKEGRISNTPVHLWWLLAATGLVFWQIWLSWSWQLACISISSLLMVLTLVLAKYQGLSFARVIRSFSLVRSLGFGRSLSLARKLGGNTTQLKGLKRIQEMLFEEMKRIDKPRAEVSIKAWVEFLRDSAGREHDTAHATLAEYMRYRILDVGEMFWFAIVTFGMGLDIPEEDLEPLRSVMKPMFAALALQNDIFSYQKELRAAKKKGTSHVVNALWVLMREHHVHLEDATVLCKTEVFKQVELYQAALTAERTNKRFSEDSRRYMEASLLWLSANAAWSVVSPRYNPDNTWNALQQSMMDNGGMTTLGRVLSDHDKPDSAYRKEIEALHTYLGTDECHLTKGK